MSQVVRLTISLPRDMISFADKVASEENISRSKVVSNCLRELAQKRKMELMEEGYEAMAKENREFAKMAFELQRRVVTDQK